MIVKIYDVYMLGVAVMVMSGYNNIGHCGVKIFQFEFPTYDTSASSSCLISSFMIYHHDSAYVYLRG